MALPVKLKEELIHKLKHYDSVGNLSLENTQGTTDKTALTFKAEIALGIKDSVYAVF